MDGQYPPPIPQLGAFFPSEPAPLLPSEAFEPRLHPLQTLSMESLGGYSDHDDPNRAMPPPEGQPRQRRRQSQGSEHVKHRRTRSGCYTCRQRRVKCDETHPVCDRCRKGKRECTYPGIPASSSSKPSRSGITSRVSLPDSGSSPSDDEIAPDDKEPLAAIPDDDEESDDETQESEPQSGTTDGRKRSDASLLSREKMRLPTNDEPLLLQRVQSRHQPSRTTSKHSVKASISQNSRWAMLPKEVRAYLRYHRDSLSHHHYAFKYDAGNFLKTTFLEIAMNDDSQALLYAVVAFAAYHHTLMRDHDRIATFLQYYNRSIMLLQQSLTKKRHSTATLLTILQLATIEEFLGDWINLLGHQRAAHQILTDLFTPQTITQDETRRRIISWYIRFDLFAGMMSGGDTILGREWFASCAEHYSRQAQKRPDDLGAKFEEYFATARLLATDVTLLFAAKTRDAISDEQFARDTAQLMGEFATFGHELETAFSSDSSCFVTAFPLAPPPSPDDITDYRDPNFLYGGEHFTMNFVLIDFWAIDLMFKYQLTLAQRQQPSPELSEIAILKCKMFEAVQYYDRGPPGAVLGCQASLGIASLFLPKDEKHTNWCRRKYALIEQKGYIYPATLRKRMTDLWGVDVTHWWLPNEEGYPKVLRAIRDFIEYRARMPADAMGADVRNMSGIFRSLNVGEDYNIPGDLKDSATDSDQFDVALDPSMSWESSPEQYWT